MNSMIKVGPKRIVVMRYRMKNSEGEILADIMNTDPVKFLFGSGEILPELEGTLTGLKIGEHKLFALSSEKNGDLNRSYHFDVVIDDILWVSESLNEKPSPVSSQEKDCWPGGCC